MGTAVQPTSIFLLLYSFRNVTTKYNIHSIGQHDFKRTSFPKNVKKPHIKYCAPLQQFIFYVGHQPTAGHSITNVKVLCPPLSNSFVTLNISKLQGIRVVLVSFFSYCFSCLDNNIFRWTAVNW